MCDRRVKMIILDVKLNNFYAFKNFHMSLTYPKKMSKYETEINRRRTFAIISHPDAGKTTLTIL